MPTRYPDGVARSHGFGTPDRTCLDGIRKGLQALTGKEHQIVNAYEISSPGCRVSRFRDTRSKTPKRYQDGAAGSHVFGPTDSTCLQGIRSGLQDLTGIAHQTEPACRISRVLHIRPNLPTRYQVGVVGSHGLGTTDRTCLLGIRWLQDLTGSKHQIEHAYEVSGRACRILRVRTNRFNMPTMYQVGVAGSHGFGPTDRTCLQGFRRGLQDLTSSKHQNERAYYVSGRRCMISRARNTISYMLTKYPFGAARSHGFRTPDRTCLQGIRKGLQDLEGKEHQIVNAYEI